MEEKSGARISRKAFIQAVAIIFILMMVAGVLTRVIPAGQYARTEVDGREVIDATQFSLVERPDYPVWRWFTAPFEVLAGKDSFTVIGIILFILLVGVAFAVMDKSGMLKAAIAWIIQAFGGRKYALLLVITFFFMALGTFFGIFEEVIPLVPIVIGLAYSLGWDSLTGLGMSVLATNVGFSTAVFNPFTIGVAHKLSGLPLFSGAGPRVVLFVVVYAILALFLTRYAAQDRPPSGGIAGVQGRPGGAGKIYFQPGGCHHPESTHAPGRHLPGGFLPTDPGGPGGFAVRAKCCQTWRCR